MITCSRHADQFVHLFPRGIRNEEPHPKYENFNTLSQFFSLIIVGIFSFMLLICTSPLIDSLIDSVIDYVNQAWDFLNYFL